MICEFCGKEGAYETIDPYLEEINEEIVMRSICDECLEERRLDI